MSPAIAMLAPQILYMMAVFIEMISMGVCLTPGSVSGF